MKKPRLQGEGAGPRQVQRADLAPATGYAIIVDGHFKTEYDEEQAAKEGGSGIVGQVSYVEDRNIRRILEVTCSGKIATFLRCGSVTVGGVGLVLRAPRRRTGGGPVATEQHLFARLDAPCARSHASPSAGAFDARPAHSPYDYLAR